MGAEDAECQGGCRNLRCVRYGRVLCKYTPDTTRIFLRKADGSIKRLVSDGPSDALATGAITP
jgi:hypothetical protein